MNWMNLLFSTQGRIGIKHYWLGIAAILVAYFLFTSLLGVTFSAGVRGLPTTAIAIPSIIFGLLSWTSQMGLFCIFVCLASKRLHDSDKSIKHIVKPIVKLLGKVFILFALATIVFLAMGGAKSLSDILMLSTLPIMFGIVGLAYIVPDIVMLAVLIVGIISSDPYENEYGEPPMR